MRSPHAVAPSSHRSLPAPAHELLEAVRRILAEKGLGALTISAVSEEARQPKSQVHYYFGGKAGLLTTLSDWLLYEVHWDLRLFAQVHHDEPDRATGVLRSLYEYASAQTPYRLFYELLPALLADSEMRQQLASLYRIYRTVFGQALFEDSDGTGGSAGSDVATICIALADGIAVQVLADPDAVDVERTLSTFAPALDAMLRTVDAARAASPAK